MVEVPYLGDTLNLIAVHPEVISFVEGALETTAILLAQSQRHVANYYALVTGIPATYWLPWISVWTNATRR